MLTSVSSQISRFIEGKQAEEALRESEERYRTLVETAPDSIFAVSLDGTLVSLNPAFEALTGWPPEEWLGKPFAPFFHPDDLSSGMELFQRILQGETLPPLEWRIRHKSGDYTTVEVTAVPRLEHGQVVGLLGIAHDITERKQSEEALRESEEKFSKAFHSNLAMLVLSTLDGKNVDVNQAYTDFLGYSREEILGKSIVDLQIVSVKERQKIFELIQRAGGSLHNAEITVQILDGSLRHILLSVEAISLGSVPHHLATLLDITERKQAEAALIESSAQFRTLFESSPDAIVLIDPHDSWPILDCNTAACQMNGYTRDELIRQFVDVLNLTPGDPAERAEYLERVRQTGILRLETLHRRKDGTMFPVEVSTSLLTLGGRDVILEIDRDITERQQRERELQAVVTVSAALRTAQTQAEMLPIIVDQLLDLLKADGAALVRHDDTTGESIMELVRGALPTTSGLRLPAGEGISGYVISRGQPYLTNDLQSDLRFAGPDVNFGRVAVACWPLIGQGQMVGALWVSRAQPFTENEQRLLSAISDIAANALRRASLHEQTEQRLQHLIALRAIDMTISSSLDLRMTLGVLLGQTVTQLRVDAADVLLLNPHLQRLDYAAGRGFRGGGITRSHLRLGECQAGRAVLERRTIHISNLAEETTFVRAGLLASENFVAHYVTPLIAKGEVKGVLEVFHRAPLAPDPEWLDFLEALAGQAAIAIDNSELFEGLQRSNMELALAYDATIEGWSHALDLRDKETEGHTLRVTEMTLRLARAAGMTEGELVHVRRGALLHDIGKMGVPDHILLKPGKLTDEEWVIMRKHPLFAYELLLPIAYLRPALDIPYSHHEKWDGSGYPRGLMSEQIPLAARLFAVVDVWDALRSDRPYRKGWPEEKVLEHIRALSGTHFDPKAVELFLRVVNEKTEEH
jgi:PAS domain S-box-containing protein